MSSNGGNNVGGVPSSDGAGGTVSKPNIQSLLQKLRDKIKPTQQVDLKPSGTSATSSGTQSPQASLKDRKVVGETIINKMEQQLEGIGAGKVQMMLSQIDKADGNQDGGFSASQEDVLDKLIEQGKKL